MKHRYLATALAAMAWGTMGQAQQLTISGEFRPRMEVRHGYRTLADTNQEAGVFVSQRSRLNAFFSGEGLAAKVSLQNVRVWGDASTLASADLGNSFHEAWAEVQLFKGLSLKAGRQEIVYDDHRIFGNVGWAQQARSHDAAVFKYAKSHHQLHFGFTLSADGQWGRRIKYSGVAGYKCFQYVWYHGDFKGGGLSLLALNRGLEYEDDNGDLKVSYMQTVGGRATFKKKKLKANGAAYVQTGKAGANDVSAAYFSADAHYAAAKGLSVGAGFEYLSGKANNDSSATVKSFTPLFGTNHKFNGWMDYFYVGNHINSVGLIDVFVPVVYRTGKWTFKLIPHMFSAAADVNEWDSDAMAWRRLPSALGTEVDAALAYKLHSSATLSAGYSRMFATETFQFLRGGSAQVPQYWGWVMLTVKPQMLINPLK